MKMVVMRLVHVVHLYPCVNLFSPVKIQEICRFTTYEDITLPWQPPTIKVDAPCSQSLSTKVSYNVEISGLVYDNIHILILV